VRAAARLVVFAALLAGCGTEVSLRPQSGDASGSNDKLVLTLGVASLVVATDGSDELDADCRATVVSADSGIVSVLEAERLNEFVLVGQSLGSTVLHIDLDGEPNRDLPVDVVE